MTTKPRTFLNVRAIAARYGCHPSSVWRWVADGTYPKPVKIGGMTRWLLSEVEAHDAKAEAQREAA